MSSVKCPQCGEHFKSIGMHWRYKPEHRKQLSQKQLEIVTGLLMGDGTLNRYEGKNSLLACVMTCEEYLLYLDDEFGILSAGVSDGPTAEYRAAKNRETGFHEDACADNYSEVYRWRTISHPQLNTFNGWYEGGSKSFPDDIELTPTVLKHWYCGDGSLIHPDRSSPYISIATSNESSNKQKIGRYFNEGPGVDIRWVDNHGRCMLWARPDDSITLWEYMGEPLPGFEYKWPEEFK